MGAAGKQGNYSQLVKKHVQFVLFECSHCVFYEYYLLFGTNVSPEMKKMRMEKNTGILHLPNSTILIRNLSAAQSYLKNTLCETTKEIRGGLSFFKEGVTGRLHKTGACINAFALPINNFIKDFAQIDKEFVEERLKNAEYCICLDGKMVPASEVAKMPMEENY